MDNPAKNLFSHCQEVVYLTRIFFLLKMAYNPPCLLLKLLQFIYVRLDSCHNGVSFSHFPPTICERDSLIPFWEIPIVEVSIEN